MFDDKGLLRVAVDVPLSREFDYLPPAAGPVPVPGCRVLVPFGRTRKVGLVLAISHDSDVPKDKIRRCLATLDSTPLLGETDLKLLRFTSDYYHHPVGEVVAAALPTLLRQGKPLHPSVAMVVATAAGENADLDAMVKRAPRQAELLTLLLDAGAAGLDASALTERLPNWRRAARALSAKAYVEQCFVERVYVEKTEIRTDDFDEATAVEPQAEPALNTDQDAALSALRMSDDFGVSLLDGVTGSGKTEVYLRRMRDVLDRGKQVLVLVPEIGLTPQLVGRFRDRLGIEPACMHSGLSDIRRLASWRAARSGAASLIVGTRSAIFTPLKDPGLIIVDEEHDHSFKQQEGLRYSARDLAIARAKHLDIPVVLGSATPTLEMLQHCRRGSYRHIELPSRAGAAVPPKVRLIDTLRSPANDGVSEPLAESIEKHLDEQGQVLIFLNRRGFAPTLICSSCGYISVCTRCDSRLTVHARDNQLRCHHCGQSRVLNEQCEECGDNVRPLGEGTERLEETLMSRFPGKRISRIDSDSTQRKGSIVEALKGATDGVVDILVGTQMLSKGHHFPNLTLVGIVNADQGLFGTDFRSGERMAQTIVQVSGRAGRESKAGEVLIQTAFPENDFWKTLLTGGYRRFAELALAERQMTRWPPFTRLALIRSAGTRKADALRFLNVAKQKVASLADESLRILGPVDAPMAKKAGRYRAQLLFQSTDRATLHTLLSDLRLGLESDPAARKVRWSIDVDPIELF